jgi:hypothetical protein
MLRIVFVSGHDVVQLTAKWPEWQSVKIHYKELYAAKDFDVVVAARPRERSLARDIAKLLRTKKIEDPGFCLYVELSGELLRSHSWCPWANWIWNWSSLGKPGCPDHASPIYLCDVVPDEAIREVMREFLKGIPEPYRMRAPFGWPGGKGRIASWVVRYIPQGKIYVEPFAGAASVFWHRTKPFLSKVLNGSDEKTVHLYHFLQGKAKYYEELARRLICMGVFSPRAQGGLSNTKRIQCQRNRAGSNVLCLSEPRFCGHREGIRRETGTVW